MRRSEQRRAAIFALYQHDVTGRPAAASPGGRASAFTRELIEAVSGHREELDGLIERHSEGWTLDRIAPLERNILRVALLELLYPELLPGEHPLPPEGAINEAIETAKKFCALQAPAFVNGILGAALRERQAV